MLKIINDISAGEMDNNMFDVISEFNATYVLMHMQGSPSTMQKEPTYNNVTNEILSFFENKLETLNNIGVENIILDPGFGFGKSIKHNYELPIMMGISRKSMIYNLLKIGPEEALNGSTILNTIGIQNGVNIIRVHDVKEAHECIKITTFAKNNC